jgi:hypothetical protein
MDDWRLQGQERFLKGAVLRAATYSPSRDGWDHDHCEFCGAKFSDRPGDLKSGYVTGDEYHWICAACYADFRDHFDWTLTDTGS